VDGRYLTTAEAAKELGVHVRSLQRWVRAGQIEPDYITPGGHMRWNVERVRRELREELRRRRLE
jgi:excisionase family DNA binding protein